MINNILITGASGFIGREVTNACQKRFPNATIKGVARHPVSGFAEAVDLLDPEMTRSFIQSFQPDAIFHLAGCTGGQPLSTLIAANVTATANLLDAVLNEAPSCRVVVSGSAAEYGNAQSLPIRENHPTTPISPYGLSKYQQTETALFFSRKGLSVCVGRVFNLIGPQMAPTSAVAQFLQRLYQLAAGSTPFLEVGNLSAQRDFLDVRDVTSALLALLHRGMSGEIYNICSGHGVSMQNILELLCARLDLQHIRPMTHDDIQKKDDISISIGSNEKLIAHTGWQPEIPLPMAIDQLIKGGK